MRALLRYSPLFQRVVVSIGLLVVVFLKVTSLFGNEEGSRSELSFFMFDLSWLWVPAIILETVIAIGVLLPTWRGTMRLGLAMFASFWIMGLAEIFSGEATSSCGCFGSVEVSPVEKVFVVAAFFLLGISALTWDSSQSSAANKVG